MTTVLAIEDETAILENILETLEIGGLEAHGAANGLEGVKIARKVMPDIIICDIAMPEMDGYGVLMELRSDPITTRIPFVFLTARVDRESQRQGMEMGADDYLTKPFTPTELLGMVRAQIDKRAAVEEEYGRVAEELRSNIVHALPHELRTPLTGIITCADMLLMDFDENSVDLDRTRQLLTIVFRAGMRLQRLIENYLVYAQVEMFDKDPERAALLRRGEGIRGAKSIIQQAAEQAFADADRAADRSLDDLVIETDGNPKIQISESSLNKISYELVSNAIKFSESGTPIHVHTATNGDWWHLTVQDKGRGMKPDQVQRLGAYMQFERQLYEQQGLGLGLIIVVRLAELHGGKVHIESTPDEGTTVKLQLQIQEA